MFILKQFLKALLLPPMPWLLMLLAVLIFWRRRWARKLLFVTFLLILALHCGPVNYALRYPLESRYPPLLDPRKAGAYDAIVVLTSGIYPASGLIPFPIHRRAYVSPPRRSLAALSHPTQTDHRLRRPCQSVHSRQGRKQNRPRLSRSSGACRKQDVIGEDNSRDTFESAVEVQKLLEETWLETLSSGHIGAAYAAQHAGFRARAPEPIPAPGDFSVGNFEFTPFNFFPSEGAAARFFATLHEYIGLANYYWRLRFSQP